MDKAASLDLLFNLFESSCHEVFDSLNCKLEKIDSPTPVKSVYSAIIKASSEDLELMLILRGPISLLKETYPIQEAIEKINIDELNDWILELANRFMGNLKNCLLSYDHSLQMGVPSKEFGVDLSNIQDYDSDILRFDVNNEVFECSLYVKFFTENVKFEYREIEDDSDSLDGELEMF